MNIKPIKTKKDYDNALVQLEKIFDAKRGTKEGDMLEILSLLIENYEEEHYPIDPPDPIEAIKFRMDQMGYNQNDLADTIGSKSRVSEVLNRKRKLTLPMIRNISKKLNIPSDTLIREYELEYTVKKKI